MLQTHSHPLLFTVSHSHSLPSTTTCSNQLSSTPTHSHSFICCHPFLLIFKPLPLIFSPFLPTLTNSQLVCTHSHPFQLNTTCLQALWTNILYVSNWIILFNILTNPHPLPSSPITPTHSHSFSVHSHSLTLVFSPALLFLTLLSPMYMLSHSFPVHIQILSPNPKHHLPFQPIFSPCVLRAYVLYVVMCLCAFVSHVTICLCNSFLCTVLPTSMNFTCLYVCQYIRTIYSQCIS